MLDNGIELVLFIITPILLFIVGAVIYLLLRQNYISKKLKQCVEDGLNIAPFLAKRSVKRLNLFASTVEKVASHKDISLPYKLGIDLLWIKALEKKQTVKRMKRVLRFGVENGLYSAFKCSLNREKLQPIIHNYIQEQKIEVILNALAKSSYLDLFDGKAAADLLEKHLEEISMMADSGSPEDRWFSFVIMGSLDDAHPYGDVKWKGFSDHSYKIREMLLKKINSKGSEKLYNAVFKLLIDDTERAIRSAAKKLIITDFQKQYQPEFKSLTIGQQIRFAENFSTEIELDKKIGFDLILCNNIELRQLSVDFLNKTDTMKKLILSIDINDPSRLKHSYGLLKSALEVSSDSFFDSLKENRNSGSLMCAAMLLHEQGDRRYIRDLANSVFSLRKDNQLDPLYSELYKKTLETIMLRGDEPAWHVMKEELLDTRYDAELCSLIMAHIPAEADVVFCDVILAFLRNPKIENRTELLKVCEKMPQEQVLSAMLHILKSGKDIPWQVRMNAVEFFKREKIELCFQYVMENLDFFPDEACAETVQQLYSYSPLLFKEVLSDLISKEDSRVVSQLIQYLSVCNDSSFYQLVGEQLESSSSEIRIAAINALDTFNANGYFEAVEPLLNDNEKKVRLLAAAKLASSAQQDEIEKIRAIILNENELQIVKKAILTGLGISTHDSSIKIMLETVDLNPALFDHVLKSLLVKPMASASQIIVDLYPEFNELAQKVICQYFRTKGIEKQELLIELLKESNNHQFKNSIREILFKTGYIDKIISRLKNKSSDIRISALGKLKAIDTYPAHKGILLAARDNNKAIRRVAFEKVEELVRREPKAIQSLKEDSSRIVQKNINWIINKLEKNRSHL